MDNVPVPLVAAATGLTPRSPDPTANGLSVWTGYDLETKEGRVAVGMAMSGEDFRIDDCNGQILALTNVVTHPATLVDKETGEVFNAVRTVIVTKDNKRGAATSEGVFKSLGLLCAMYGRPPWTKGIKVKVERKQTRNGWKVLLLQPAE